MPNVGYYSEQFGYYEGDLQHGDKVVPVKPEPRDEHVLINLDVQNEDGTWGTWQHDPTLPKKALGKVPTAEFVSRVFAPSASNTSPTPDYVWNRENVIRMISPATSARMPKDGFLSGSKAEIMQIAGWMLTYTVESNTYPPVFTPLAPNPDGTFMGGIISQDEYNRVLPLLDEYGVL